jgi:hypothetical protein
MPERRRERTPHPDPGIEAALAAAESMRLIVEYHPVGFARGGAEVGFSLVACQRGCPEHDRVRINHLDWSFIDRQALLSWIGKVMADRDKQDVAGSE